MSPSWPTNWPPFLWGVATSSHQIEGDNQNDWTAWEEQGRVPEPSGKATNHWQHWPDDFALLSEIGVNAYRFSLEWSRIQPAPDRVDSAAIRQYRAMIAFLRQNHIVPVVTLHHFTLPLWVSRQQGVQNPRFPQWFRRYTEVVMNELGDLVDLYVTINEPMVLVVMGYLIRRWPPGKTGFRRALGVIDHLVEAHRDAYAAIKKARPSAWVGLAHHVIDFQPFNPRNPLDRVDARLLRYLMNRRVIRLVGTQQDFLGMNYYTRQYARWYQGLHPLTTRGGQLLTDMGWEIQPEGLETVVRDIPLTDRPVLITENGIATEDDALRQQYIRRHLTIVAKLQQQGFAIRGYFYWSFLDNFEWAEGYRPRFGLVGINYRTEERQIRPSAHWYRRVIEANRSRYPINVPEE